eukprot:TRINITY_DN5542_c0_g1_i1.p1 TRINITY_DN5542_c0_g1~~TRINITY_DN5542_c0_g1_i1.p1  ORF type:complete len:1022 (+),score=141.02 TRINITY_DN5542_c0_g1_i1:292-3066(+)
MGVRSPCPLGTICPGYGNSLPIPCSNGVDLNNQTCFEQRLTTYQECPYGSVCRVPYLPPFPSPPGFYSPIENRTDFTICALGEYCIIGRHDNESRLCPANVYCPQPDVMVPIACTCDRFNNKCSYCPEGTYWDQPCPEGYKCRGPANISICDRPGTYCPAGVLTEKPCLAGYYCRTPKEMSICPEKHYCRMGTSQPLRCSSFSFCPEGTSSDNYNFTPVFVFLLVLGIIVGAWKYAHYVIDKRHREKQKQRLQVRAEYNSAKIKSGDEFHIFVENQSNNTPPPVTLRKKLHTVDISFENLSLTIEKKNSKKVVLSGVNGVVRAGRITAVMGPSGAGKTTFMTTLAGKAYYGKTGGILRLNGVEAPIKNIRSMMGFVPQEDVMLRTLTVKDILTFNANMRLPRNTPAEERRAIVNSVISLLGLDEIAYSPIGDETKRGISGGQRKRVNIGMELVANPTVLFLDEPTSGLDSTSSLELAKILRTIAELGLTVVTVIHQPRYDIFTMFHDVLLLGKGGKTVYLGPSNQCLDYFTSLGFKIPKHSNPADFFMDIISGNVPRKGHPDFTPSDLFDEWQRHCNKNGSQNTDVKKDKGSVDSYSVSSEDTDEENDKKDNSHESEMINANQGFNKANFKSKKASFFYQFWLYFYRSIKQQAAEVKNLATDVFLVILIAIIFGMVFQKSEYIGPPPVEICESLTIPDLIKKCRLPIKDPFFVMGSFVGLALSLAAATFSLRVFGNEKVVFWRESSVGGNTVAYYLGKDLSYLPNAVFLPLIFMGVFYSLVSPSGVFRVYYAIVFLCWFNGSSMGYLISVIMKPAMAQVAVVILIFMLMLFSGVQPTLYEMDGYGVPMKYLPYLSYLRYANELFYLNEIKNWKNTFNEIQTGLDAYMYNYNMEIPGYVAMLAIGLGIRIIAMILMHVLDMKKRL